MLIKRDTFPLIEQHLNNREITLITGARQVGKSTIMHLLQDKLQKEGYKTLFFNLDFESDFKFFESQQLLLQKISLETGNEKGYIFIDEIQRKENAGLFLKGIYDKTKQLKFIVSGSGSLELKEKIHESLAGRKRIFELLPVNFSEFVNYSTQYRYDGKLQDFFGIEIEKTERLLHEYLSFGGYPAIVTSDNEREKTLLMNEIFSSYVRKDISFLLNLERPDSFVKMIEWLAHRTGSGMNFSTCSNDIGLSVPTLKKYLWYAEHTFIIKSVTPFFRNRRKEITKSPAFYFFDTGLLNFSLGHYGMRPPSLTGAVFENFVFSILYNHSKNTGHNLHYWRTTDQAEVDFVITSGMQVIPVEVKFSHLKRDKITGSLRSFISKYNPKNAWVVNLSYRNTVRVDDTEVRFIPFTDLFFNWMLLSGNMP